MTLKYLENEVFKYLVENFNSCIARQEHKIFNEKRYVNLPCCVLKKEFDLSNYKQRQILNKLVFLNLISVKFGQARERFYSCDSPETLEHINLKKEIRYKINKIKDVEILKKIKNFIGVEYDR